MLIPHTRLTAWDQALRLAETLIDLDQAQQETVIARIRTQARDALTAANDHLGAWLRETLTFPPIDTARLHSEPEMRAQNEKLMLALVGATNPVGPLSRVLRVGELPEFGPLLSEAGMNSDVYAFGEREVVKFVRYGEEAAKLLHDAIGKLADDPRLKDIILPVRMLREDGAHLVQERIPISYLRPEMQPKLDELVGIAREILHIPNGPDKAIYIGKFRLLIDDQPTNITQQLQWYDPVYLSIRQAER